LTNQEYSLIKEICNNICRQENLVKDLEQEVALIFLELPEDKRTKVRGYFKFWVVRVVSNLWRSNTSPFWTKYRSDILMDPNDAFFLSEDPIEIDDSPSPYDILDNLVESLYPSDKNVYVDYYKKGLTIIQITHKYDCEKSYIWSVLDRIRSSFKRRTDWIQKEPESFSSILCPILERSLRRRPLRVSERQIILDVNNHLGRELRNNIQDRKEISDILKELQIELDLMCGVPIR